jgi:hypothetical protein
LLESSWEVSSSLTVFNLRNSITSFFNLIFSLTKLLLVLNISNEEKLKSLLINTGVGASKLNLLDMNVEKLFSEKTSTVSIVVDKRMPKI